MYSSYGLYLLKHFVVALTKVCTVKLALLTRFKWARVIVCLPGLNRTILRRNMFSISLYNSFLELPGIKSENLGKAKTYLTFMSILKKGKTNMNHNA